MIKTCIIFYDARTLKCDLSKITGVRFVLVTPRKSIEKWQSTELSFFEEVLTVESINEKETLPIVEKYRLSYGDQLCLTTSDESCMQVLVNLREKFRIDGPTLADILPFTDKIAMKNALKSPIKNHHFRIPRYKGVDQKRYINNPEAYLNEIENYLNYPMFAKPINLFGAAGTQKINSKNKLKKWFESIQESDIEFEIEEYIDGVLYHCDAVIQKGHVAYSMVYEYTWPCALFNRGYPLGTILLPSSNPLWDQLNNVNLEVIRLLKPPDGATHLEIFRTESGEIIFLEIAARPVGGLVIPIHEYTTGINLELEHFKAQLGIQDIIKEKHEGDYFAWAYLPKQIGIIEKLESPSIKSKYNLTWFVSEGENISELLLKDNDMIFADHLLAGKIIWHHPDYEILYQDFDTLKKINLIRLKNKC